MSRIIILVLGRVLNAVGAIFAVRLYTELLVPEQVGKLSLFLSLIALFNFLLIVPVSTYVVRKAIDWHAEGLLCKELKRPLLYSIAAGFLAAIGSEIFLKLGLLHASVWAVPLIGLAVSGMAVSGVGSLLFNYFGRPLTFVMLSCLTNWGVVLIAGAFCASFSSTAEVWIFGLVAAQLVGGCLAIFLIRKLPQDCAPSLDRNRKTSFGFRAVASYSMPLLLATGFSWAQTDGYRYVFVHIADEHTLGLFVAGFAIGVSPLAFVDRLITDAYTPNLTRDLAFKNEEHWPQSWDAYVSSAILPLVLFSMFACSGTNLFTKILVSSSYSAVSWIGVWGGFIKSLQMMASLYVGFSYAALKTKHLPICNLIGTVVMLLCMPVFMKAFDPIIGATVSLSCGALAVLISVAHYTKTQYGLRFPYAVFSRAVLIGMPIVFTNLLVQAVVDKPTTFISMIVIGCELMYIAAVCWCFYPKLPISASFQQPVIAVPAQEA